MIGKVAGGITNFGFGMAGKALDYGLIGAGIGAATLAGAGTLGGMAAQTGGDTSSAAFTGGALGFGAAVGTTALVANGPKIGAALGGFALNKGKQLGKFGITKGKELGTYLSNVNYLDLGKKVAGKAIDMGAGVVGTAGAVGAVGLTAAAKSATKMGAIGASMFKVSKGVGTVVPDIKLSAFGKTAVLGGGLIAAGASAFNTLNTARRGTSDGQVTTATPQTPQYSSQMRDAGATGDLNFAMHRNRR